MDTFLKLSIYQEMTLANSVLYGKQYVISNGYAVYDDYTLITYCDEIITQLDFDFNDSYTAIMSVILQFLEERAKNIDIRTVEKMMEKFSTKSIPYILSLYGNWQSEVMYWQYTQDMEKSTQHFDMIIMQRKNVNKQAANSFLMCCYISKIPIALDVVKMIYDLILYTN